MLCVSGPTSRSPEWKMPFYNKSQTVTPFSWICSNALADLGGVPGARPLRVQILSFRHTKFSKSNCLRSQCPPYEVHAALYGKSWIRHCNVQSTPPNLTKSTRIFFGRIKQGVELTVGFNIVSQWSASGRKCQLSALIELTVVKLSLADCNCLSSTKRNFCD